MSGELAERDGGWPENTEQKKNGMEAGRRYFKDTNPISIFLGMGRCLDLAIFELLWLENGGISGSQIRIALRGARALRDAMI